MPGKNITFRRQTSNIKMSSIPIQGCLRVTTTPSCSHIHLKRFNMPALPTILPTRISSHIHHYINLICCAIIPCRSIHRPPTTWVSHRRLSKPPDASAVVTTSCSTSFLQVSSSISIPTLKQREVSHYSTRAKATRSSNILRRRKISTPLCPQLTTTICQTSIAIRGSKQWRARLPLPLNIMARPAL